MLRNNVGPVLLWLLKLVAAIFQGIATYFVFLEILKETDRAYGLAIINAFMASILIDLFLLYVLDRLETDELTPPEKWPWVFAAIALGTSVLLIGMLDEGLAGWMPRVGFLGIIVADLFVFWNQRRMWLNNRERIEEELRDIQVIFRARMKEDTWEEAMEEIRPILVERWKRFELAKIGMENHIEVDSKHEVVADTVLSYDVTGEPHQIKEHVFFDGQFYWVDSNSNEIRTTSLGKTYSEQGACLAAKRHWNQVHGRATGKLQKVQGSIGATRLEEEGVGSVDPEEPNGGAW